jgi:transposase InsO family protein
MTTPTHIIERIKEIRSNDKEKSKYEIHEELEREGIRVAHNVIQKVINRHADLQNTQHVKRIRSHKKRTIARIKAGRELKDKHIGALVQIDTKHLYVLGKRFYVFVAIDCASRFALMRGYRHASSQVAADFLEEVLTAFPFSVTAVNTDNGSEYLLNFHKACEARQITHYFSHPHTPQMNSRAERLIRTLQYEYVNHAETLLPELDSVQEHCKVFNDHYNTKRFHQALHYKTPYERVVELMHISNGGTVRYV